ncbi:MAG: hypothetical protein ACP5U0_09765 [Caldisphaera sp.]
MGKNEHIIFFYRFKMVNLTPDDIKKTFISQNSKNNSWQLRRNYALFIIDKIISDNIIEGRYLKINVGLYRRINIDKGDEWIEQIRRDNGIEFESYLVIDFIKRVMAATYNTESFGILDKSMNNYFRKVFNGILKNENSYVEIKPLALPDAVNKLLNSKVVQKIEIKLSGETLPAFLDLQGEGPGGLLSINKDDAIISASTILKYEKDKKSLEPIKKIIKTLVGNKSKFDTKNDRIIIETETGYYSLIKPTLLNDTIIYDDESEYDRNEGVYSEMLKSIDRKESELSKAIELSEREELDFYMDQ